MAVDVLDQVPAGDPGSGIDQVGGPPRRRGRLLFRSPADLVPLSHRPVLVGQEAEREAELLGEGQVRARWIEGGTQDLRSGLLELGGSITEPLALDPSPGGVGHDEPPQHHPPVPEVGEGDRRAVLVRQGKVRRRGPVGEHGRSVSRVRWCR